MRRSPCLQRRRATTPEVHTPRGRHVAHRTCIGCRRRADASELWRLVMAPDGEIVVDRHGNGRGAWLCADSAACCNEAVRRRAFGRAFRRPVEPVAVTSLARAFEAGSVNVRESRVTGRPTGAPLSSRKG